MDCTPFIELIPNVDQINKESIPRKRKLPPWMTEGFKKIRKIHPKTKMPVMALNEYLTVNQCGLISEVLQEKELQADGLYVFSCTINGVTYFGKAPSKKIARQAACDIALRLSNVLTEEAASEVIWLKQESDPLPTDTQLDDDASRTMVIAESKKEITKPNVQTVVDCISRLSQTVPDVKYETSLRSEMPSGSKLSKKYECTVTVPSFGSFLGHGRSMKIAKQMAAYMALTQGLKLTSPHPRKKQQQIGKTEDAKLPLAIKAEVKSDTSETTGFADALYRRMPELKFEFGEQADGMKLCRTVLNDVDFIGKGLNKKIAKNEVARMVLDSMPPLEKSEAEDLPELKKTILVSEGSAAVRSGSKKLDANSRLKTIPMPCYPTTLICLLYPQDTNFLSSTHMNSSGQFTCTLTIGSMTFAGSGVNKKAAKAAASRVAACALHPEIRISPTTGDCFLTNPQNMDSTIDFSSDDIDMLTFTENFSDTRMCSLLMSDTIAKCVRDKFVELTTGNEIASKKKILAGFVMTENMNPATARVIAVATGTKCISGGELSIDGNSVQDCHAEIIAKRGVRLFFIEQMKAALDLRESIFTHLPDGRFQLHPGIHFHLFVSSATCGDARIYCLQETVGNSCPASKVRNAGVLRTKIESGEGTIPVQGNSQQTFDAIVGGSPLLTMSCSDKVCRWNVTGFQGALLSRLLDRPIYLSTIIFGSVFNPVHMRRAFVDRVKKCLGVLPSGYSMNEPEIGTSSSLDTRNVAKSVNQSINWFSGCDKMEILNGVNGKTLSEAGGGKQSISRLCKSSIFAQWIALSIAATGVKKQENLYADAKAAATDYQEAKKAANSSLETGGFSSWVSKPLEIDSFALS